MERKEIIEKIEEFAKLRGYKLTKYIERIAEAKRRMGGKWFECPCHRDGEHYCGSIACQKEIEENGFCGCNLFEKGETR